MFMGEVGDVCGEVVDAYGRYSARSLRRGVEKYYREFGYVFGKVGEVYGIVGDIHGEVGEVYGIVGDVHGEVEEVYGEV